MSEEKVFEIDDRVKTDVAYNEHFGEEYEGIIIEIQNTSSIDFPSFCAIISIKDGTATKYINFDWLELVE